MRGLFKHLATFAAAVSLAQAIELNVNDTNSIREAASTIVYNLLKEYYNGNVTTANVGILPKPYYWWEAGAMWGGLVDYTAYSRDHTYAAEIGQAIASQASPTNDFMMPNQHFDLGNDDQGFWALTAASALEEHIPVPQGLPKTLWLDLCVNSFNDFVSRWNTTTCNGGLKWQIFPSNVGFDYKSTIANAAFMQLAARLARYTDNSTYADWAEKSFDWLEGVGFINSTSWLVNDGAGDANNCTAVDQAHWTYNAAASMYASAVMYNITQSDLWGTRMNGIVATAAKTFFSPYSNATNIMYEAQCELSNTCDNDQYSFKAYLSRWMAKSALVVSNLTQTVQPLLTESASAAAQACSGNGNNTCGMKWYVGGYDGGHGVGQYMSALETIQSLLVFRGVVQAPSTAPNVHWYGRLTGKMAKVHRSKPT